MEEILRAKIAEKWLWNSEKGSGDIYEKMPEGISEKSPVKGRSSKSPRRQWGELIVGILLEPPRENLGGIFFKFIEDFLVKFLT